MTYRKFLADYINPYLTDDRGANNLMFSCTIDSLTRNGQITDKQAQNWRQPDNLKFHTQQELKNLKNYKASKTRIHFN